ncbi:hypothetical protein HQN89_27205 [Paenibacillus frigoriresistens]|nr:hypothetical protein [Paenibacillus frigoriresistens]
MVPPKSKSLFFPVDNAYFYFIIQWVSRPSDGVEDWRRGVHPWKVPEKQK